MATTAPAAVDVLITAYNAEATLAETVASLQQQSFSDFTLHIVNDGSTDGTLALTQHLAADDPRIRIYDKPNGGIVQSLNHGLQFCTAEFIARIDADDLAYPQRLAVQVAHLRAHPDVVAVGAAMRHVDSDGKPLGTVARFASVDGADPENVPCIEPYLIQPVVTIRHSALKAIGGYRELYFAEDTDLYWRLLSQGRLVNLPDVLGDYRMHANSVSSASILNGRMLAICSQLTGISELRRRRGVADIVFRRSDMLRYRAAGSLAAMVDLAAADLDPGERRHFEQSVAAKLVELTAYRPYEPDADDCTFIGRIARAGFENLKPVNRGVLRRQMQGGAARIAAAGRMRDALAMLPDPLHPGFVSRYLVRAVLPDPVRRALRRRHTKESPAK